MVSAKVAEVHEVTPQTDYIFIESDGACRWDPRFELSASHCSVDVTWFPFDAQRCQLVFQSWILLSDEININVLDDVDVLAIYVPTDEWNLTGKLKV